ARLSSGPPQRPGREVVDVRGRMDKSPSGSPQTRQPAVDVSGGDDQMPARLEPAAELFQTADRMNEVLDRIPHAHGIVAVELIGQIQKISTFNVEAQRRPRVFRSSGLDLDAANVPMPTGQLQEESIGRADLEELPPGHHSEKISNAMAEISLD